MVAQDEAASERTEILTPDQRLRVFVSSTLNELAEERGAARRAIERLCLTPVMFELGARPHPPRALYLAYLRQSHVFVGIYGDQYGWTAPEMEMSGLEDELRHATRLPMLIYLRRDASRRDPRLTAMIDDVAQNAAVSYKTYSSANELESLLASDLAVLLTERFAVLLGPPAAMTVPRPASEFVGRRAELAELAELVTRDSVRLVTLTGPGGIGKTRLALELAYTLAERFDDGTVFVPLAARGPDEFLEAISVAVGLKDLGEQPLMELVVERLRDRRCLLVLDNFEHLASAAGELAGLLERTRTARALVTSRTALRLTGEQEFLVPPLGVPFVTERVDDVLRAEAAQLFCRRVAAIRRGYRLSEDDAAAVARICRRLDGLPLALELVAARANVMSVQQLGARLGMVLDLSSRSPDVPARQRTLRQTMDWSFSQLPPTGRTALPQLGVFIGSFTLDAAGSVCEADEHVDLLDTLASLVDHSLLRPHVDAERARFSMLELVREYACSHLSPEAKEQAAGRHAEYYRNVARTAYETLRGTDERRVIEDFEVDVPNIRLAMDWFLSAGRRSEAADICWWMWSFHWMRGALTEGRRWIQEVLAAEGELPPLQRARLLAGDAYLASWQRDLDAAGPEALEAFNLSERTGDTELRILVHILLLFVSGATGDGIRARSSAAEAIRLARAHGDRWAEGLALVILCLLEAASGRFEGNESTFDEALGVAREAQDWSLPAMALTGMAELRLWQGRPAEAAALLTESLGMFAKVGMVIAGAGCLHSIAFLLAQVDDWSNAVQIEAAADAALVRLQAELWSPWLVARRDQLLANAREKLGDAQYEHAYNAGQGWAFERATLAAQDALASVGH
jgi:predicted ATPase